VIAGRRIKPLPPRVHLARRMVASGAFFVAFIAVSLGIGAVGYHVTAHLGWLDATLNASMILTGMGPVNPLTTPGAKLFATAYSIYSGVAFLSSVAVLLSPVVQRFLHRFHLDAFEDDGGHPTARPGPRATDGEADPSIGRARPNRDDSSL
jgi:hypothetical protein